MSDSLGDRMKRYEGVYHAHAIRRVPLVLRLDGRAFHAYTRANGCERPFDSTLRLRLLEAASEVMTRLQGAVLAYHQSDEVSIALLDTKRTTSEPHFGYDIQKIVSTTASALTKAFAATGPAAEFDCRAFSVPADDLANYFLWRARDWKRNSLQMLARAHFSHRELQGKGQEEMHELLHSVGVNWADLAGPWKNGTYIVHATREWEMETRATYQDVEALWFTAAALYASAPEDEQLSARQRSEEE